jgi:hypothetical protein
MAISLAAGVGDYLKRTSAFLNPASDSTVMVWAKFGTVPAPAAYQTVYIILDDPAVYVDYTGIFTDTTDTFLDVKGTSIFTGTGSTAGVWYHFAWSQTGQTQRFYVNGVLIGSAVKNREAFVTGFELLGGDTFSSGDLTLAFCREWQAALTLTEIRAEMGSKTVQRTANLFLNCPLESDALDISGNGHDFTEIGSVTYTDDTSPLAVNSVIADAIAVGSLPQDITLDTASVGNFWYVYSAPDDEVIIGVFGIASLSDTLTTKVWLGPTGSPTAYLDLLAENLPMQVPVETGTSYYVQFSTLAPLTTDATLSFLPGPSESVPVGAIFTNDEVLGFPTGCVSAVDGENFAVLQFFNPPPATTSENGGDVLDDGTILLADDWTTQGLIRYNGQLVSQGAVAGVVDVDSGTIVRTCVTPQVFYAGHLDVLTTGKKDICRVDASGVMTDSWTAVASLNAIAAKNDETIIYTTSGATVSPPIKQFVTASSTFTTDLVAGQGALTRIRDLLVLGDDSVLAIYTGSGAVIIRRFDAAGTLLNTYTVPGGDSNEVSLFHALDDPTSFWTRVHNVTAECTYINYETSSGTALATIRQATYSEGEYDGTPTLTPTARFGISGSCPSFILREAIGPPTPSPGTPEEFLIRRERWFPVINQENQRMTFSMLQVDLSAGTGLTTGQGSDPLLELDWSDDGGHTWSNLRFIPTGRLGQYNRRAIARVLGQSRQRVFRIAFSEPCQLSILDGYMKVTPGLS